MNFSINTSVFASAASAVDRAVTSTSVQPSLRGIKIQAVNDSLILTGSNSDISIMKTLHSDEENNLNIVEEGTILI